MTQVRPRGPECPWLVQPELEEHVIRSLAAEGFRVGPNGIGKAGGKDCGMFLKNRWYLAAYSREVTRLEPLARTFLNEKVVLFRTRAGEALALEDRCPHRFAPLSVGRMTHEGIACGYHGMEFGRGGKCLNNPTQPNEKLHPNACVRAYPLEERHGMIWIWMGLATDADANLIPDWWYYDHPDWRADTQYMHVKGNYLLVVDNLLDLSHINFVHEGILGDPELADRTTSKTERTDRGLVDRWFVPDAPMVAGWAETIRDPWAQGNVDFWIDMHWEPASNLMLDVGVMPVGGKREQGLQLLSMDAITPETATTTHYFYGTSLSFHNGDTTAIDFWRKAQTFAFEQDRRIIEAVQSNMGSDWDILTMTPVINKGDRAALQARRIMRKLILEESGSPDEIEDDGENSSLLIAPISA
ncbi:LysR family transcriptional regulator [Sphingobium lactosutens]|uniref:aromatic ring-hydroxylating dioxygenase subunit alpha n=1 Tax=Sphingobium lactosutens TaxID=522773 RepID=UPI0015C1872C|nr:aromatic ring-hydroxylating dioxygenase subunit alpha [Sphingobium lactosutens]NWK97468.1 LysR family transcriptional regulator [Sphingobium lactosutens]